MPSDNDKVIEALLADGYSFDEIQDLINTYSSPVDAWREVPATFRMWVTEPGYKFTKKELDERERETKHPGGLFPEVLAELEAITSTIDNPMDPESFGQGPMKYQELVATGSIGAAKTTVVVEALLWVLHRLLCLRSPQLYYGIDPADEIEIVFQSVNKTTAREVGYDRLKERVNRSPWFQRYAQPDPNVTAQLVFPHQRVVVKPITSSTTGAIGQNVIAALIDETEFQQVVRDSKRADEVGGVWNQAKANYTTMRNRINSRFRNGGLLCLVSSANRKTGFIEERAKAAETDPSIYVYRKTHYQIAPWLYSPKTFEVFIGDESRTAHVITEHHPVSDEDREAGFVIQVPVDLRTDFEHDILAALRDLAGVGTDAIHPFFTSKAKLKEAFGTTESVVSLLTADFTQYQRPMVNPAIFGNRTEPRYAHVDLSISHDACGLAMGYVEGFTKVYRGKGKKIRVGDKEEEQSEWEVLPKVVLDFVLQIRPPPGGEIDFATVREFLYGLRQVVPLTWVSSDKYQSHDFLKIMRSKGYRVGTLSLDENTWGYDVLKQAINDGRVRIPHNPDAHMELIQLERDLSNPKRPKVDHPASGCFTGDTRVALADGTCPTFKELAGRGQSFDVYSMSPSGVEIVEARSARVTKTTQHLVEILLDNYQTIRCTPEHLFMTLDHEWIQAQNLTPDISIMPLYRSTGIKGGYADYERVWCPVRKERLLTHHVAIGTPVDGGVVHHRDHNRRNNSRDNLEFMTREEHYRHHGSADWGYKKSAMREGHRAYYANEENREAQRARMLRQWQSGRMGSRREGCSVEGCDRTSNARGLCDMHYQRAKRAKALPPKEPRNKNHRVMSVTHVHLEEPVEVYDLTVPVNGNFALATGVFVHNSKDLADAIAGVVSGLSNRADIWHRHGIRPSEVPFLISSKPKRTGKDKT